MRIASQIHRVGTIELGITSRKGHLCAASQVAHKADALKVLVEGLERRSQAYHYIQAMLSFADGPEHTYRDVMLKAGLLKNVEPIILAGPYEPAYINACVLVCLLANNGHKRHRAALAESTVAGHKGWSTIMGQGMQAGP